MSSETLAVITPHPLPYYAYKKGMGMSKVTNIRFHAHYYLFYHPEKLKIFISAPEITCYMQQSQLKGIQTTPECVPQSEERASPCLYE